MSEPAKPSNTSPNKSMMAKSNARLAAAQLLYRVHMTGETWTPEKLSNDYANYFEEPLTTPPHRPTLLNLLQGIQEHAALLDTKTDILTTEEWKKDRSSPLLVIILQLGTYELLHKPDRPKAIIIKEYTGLTRRFFEEKEAAFIQAALNKVV